MMLLFHHCARRDVIIAVWGCKQEGCHPSESFCSFSVPSFACGNGDNVFVSILKEKKTWLPQNALYLKKKKKKEGEGRGVRCGRGGAEHSPLFSRGWSCNFFFRFTDTEKK